MSTPTTWNHHLRAYVRAHGLESSVGVRADDVRAWIEEQIIEWLEGVKDCGFDTWLDDRFPDPLQQLGELEQSFADRRQLSTEELESLHRLRREGVGEVRARAGALLLRVDAGGAG